MTIEDIEYRIKLNILRIKYSKNPMEVVYLHIDNAMILVEFHKHFTTPKFKKGIAPVGKIINLK